jgi:hypothetical protein
VRAVFTVGFNELVVKRGQVSEKLCGQAHGKVVRQIVETRTRTAPAVPAERSSWTSERSLNVTSTLAAASSSSPPVCDQRVNTASSETAASVANTASSAKRRCSSGGRTCTPTSIARQTLR